MQTAVKQMNLFQGTKGTEAEAGKDRLKRLKAKLYFYSGQTVHRNEIEMELSM